MAPRSSSSAAPAAPAASSYSTSTARRTGRNVVPRRMLGLMITFPNARSLFSMLDFSILHVAYSSTRSIFVVDHHLAAAAMIILAYL
jgi:hypothetical protein